MEALNPVYAWDGWQHHVSGEVKAVEDYHPYRQGRNPEFGEFDDRILDLKNNCRQAVQFFFDALDPFFRKNIAVAVVPGHDPNSAPGGIWTLAKMLANSGRFNALGALTRRKPIERLCHGGCRDIEIHLESIAVDETLVRDRVVLLLDDVRTTGNSMDACIQLLYEAKPGWVQGFALAQTT